MRIPDFEQLRKGRCEGEAQGVHPNPKFFKYYWWVFWKGSPVDGAEFLSDTYRLNAANAVELLTTVENGGAGKKLRRLKMVARMCVCW